jgi:hypothetical protein
MTGPSPVPAAATSGRRQLTRFVSRALKAASRILRSGWCTLNAAIAIIIPFAPIVPGLVDLYTKPGLIWGAFICLYALSQVPLLVVLAFRRRLRWCAAIPTTIFAILILNPDLYTIHKQNTIIYIGYKLFASAKIKKLKRKMVAEHQPYVVLHAVMYDGGWCTLSIILDTNHNYPLPDGDNWVEQPGEKYIEHVHHIATDVISEHTCV